MELLSVSMGLYGTRKACSVRSQVSIGYGTVKPGEIETIGGGMKLSPGDTRFVTKLSSHQDFAHH